jgi:hypothetical protein
MKAKEAKEALKEQIALFKKEKPFISKGQLKRITGVKNVDAMGCYWFDRWVDQLVRERSYPPQLKSDDFYSLLGRYFNGEVILEVLDKARVEYRRAFPLCEPEESEDLSWLVGVLKADPNALSLLPPDYLDDPKATV